MPRFYGYVRREMVVVISVLCCVQNGLKLYAAPPGAKDKHKRKRRSVRIALFPSTDLSRKIGL